MKTSKRILMLLMSLLIVVNLLLPITAHEIGRAHV